MPATDRISPVQRLRNRAVLMARGRTVWSGSVEETLEAYCQRQLASSMDSTEMRAALSF